MSRPNPLILLSILLVTFTVFSWLGLRQDALLVSVHEGDTYHLLDILLRMEQGLVPHLDFMTPLGILSFLPIEYFLSRGFGVGHSLLWSQVLVAAIFLPAIWYVSWSKLSPKVGYFFGAFAIIQTLALAFGGSEPGLSMSMHYNRWGWVIGFLIIFLAFAPGRDRPYLDGILLGIGLSILVFLKVTFFVGLLPGIALVLCLNKRWSMISATTFTGLVAAGFAVFVLGFDFILQYVSDLATVSGSDVRPHAGVSLGELISQASTIALTVVGFMTYLLISRAGHRAEAFGLLLLVPGCIFITYQNFGNDPKWLVPMIALMLVLRPEPGTRIVQGADMYTALTGLSMAAILLFLPSATSLFMSSIRHAAQDITTYEPMLPALPEHADLRVRSDRGNTLTAQVELDVPGSVWSKYRDAAMRSEPDSLGGIELPACELQAGALPWFKEISSDLALAGLPSGSQFFVADIFSVFWLFGDFSPLEGGAPWYYGNLSGLDNADYVLVPKCGFVSRGRTLIVDELEASEYTLTPVRNNELYVLYSVAQP